MNKETNFNQTPQPSTYAVIDLKSFYASVKCVELGLDPFEANLVVADASRGEGSVCLAVTQPSKLLA